MRIFSYVSSIFELMTSFGRILNPKVLLPGIGIMISVIEVFQVSYFTHFLVGQAYLFLLMSCFLPLSFVYFWPSNNKFLVMLGKSLSIISFSCGFYFFLTASSAFYQGWEVKAPLHALIFAFLLLILVLISVRLVGGWPLLVTCLFFGLLPLYTAYMPNLLKGVPYSLWSLVTFHVLGTESLVGLPMRVVARILIGYLVFGVILMVTGGGKFFLNFALSLLGKYRGGAAKVSIFSSAFFGSLSGSVVANVITTGSFTIPAMMRSGFPGFYAAAVEACASTGGVLMPPVMGATAFIMAEFLNTSYLNVIKAAFIPSLLYYLTLFLQVDCYSGKNKISGLPSHQIPSLRTTLKHGWHYIVSFAALIFFLAIYRLEIQAPFYASAVLLALMTLRKDTRLSLDQFILLMEKLGETISNIMITLLGVGLIIGSLSMTGIAFSFAGQLTDIAGGNIFYLLGLGAAGSYVLGMGMTVSACYIFLALVLAPAIIQLGFNPMGVHLFFMYCGMLSYITPPVAIGAFSAASIAGARPMTVGVTAMRLGVGMWVLPFMFVLCPSVILQGAIWKAMLIVAASATAFMLIAQGAEGFIVLSSRKIGLVARIIVGLVGLGILFIIAVFARKI